MRPDDILYGLSIKEIARICKVDLTTARRWKRGAKCPPETALMILAQDLGCFHPDWAGWVINARGELCSPENWISTPGAVRALQMMHATLGAYRRENQALKEALRRYQFPEEQPLPEQPLPEDWTLEDPDQAAGK